MDRSTERAGALLLALALASSGCVTGHLLDEGRRWERPVAVEEAAIAGARLHLAYTVEVTDDDGGVRGRRSRRAAVALDDVLAGLPVDRVRVEPLPADEPLAGTPVPIVPAAPGGGPARIELAPVAGSGTPPLYTSVLTRPATARWVYPLVPAALAVDAVAVPVLLFFAPAVIVIGD